ncbi:hypothetical protein MMC31_006030 [Peltigera leucophlebia]|nr:hypothetical protein [Peltigera leucophlebia]
MRASIVVSSLLTAGALGKPIKRDYACENAAVWKTVTAYTTNIATERIPTVTVREAFDIAKSVTDAAIVVPTSETPSSSAVQYRHQHKRSAYNTTVSAAYNTSTTSASIDASASPATKTALPRSKLHVFVTDAPWLLEALSTATLSPKKLASTSQVILPSSENASSTISTFKLHAFVTDAPWLKKELSTATLPPMEPTSTREDFTSSSENASPTSTPPPVEETTSTPLASTPTPEMAPEPVNHSQDQALEDTETTESDGSPYSDGVHLLTTINKWRHIYKLPLLKWNHQLEINAFKTGTDGAGVDQNHELNEGTLAEVIAPGMRIKYGGDLGGDTPFELSYVAWLCESSSDAELKSDGTDHCQLVEENLHVLYSEKDTYDILTSEAYTNIGCAFVDNPDLGNDTPYQGLWVCDLS